MKKLNSFYLLYLGACVVVLLLLVGQPALAQKIRIIATDNVGRDTVILGLRADATNDIDAALGEEELPPYSPSFDFRSTTNPGPVGRDTTVHGTGPGGLRINYHRLVTVTQTDRWKLRFQSDDANGTAVNFMWEILEAGAGGWEMEDGMFPVNMPANIDMNTQSSYTYPVKTLNEDNSSVYINYYDGLKLRTATSHDIGTAPDAKNNPAGKPIKLKADKASWCFTIPASAVPADQQRLVISFGNAVYPATLNFSPFTAKGNLDAGKNKVWEFTNPPGNVTTPVTISGWSVGGKAQKMTYAWGAAATKGKLKDQTSCGLTLLNPMPNWWNVIIELYAQGVWNGNLLAGKAAGLVVGQPSLDGKSGRAVYHPKYGDIYKTLYKKGLEQSNAPRCLDGPDADPVNKFYKKPLKSNPPDKYNSKLLGDAVAFRVNLALYSGAGKVEGAAGVFQTLKYKNPASPFNDMSVSQIDAIIDGVMACADMDTNHTPVKLDVVLADINAAFSGGSTIDTSQWAGKLVMTGVKAIGKSGVLYRNSLEAAPVMALPPFHQEYDAPMSFKLEQNYPNPFNPTTTIEFVLPKEGMVTLKVYNLLGQEVATLLNQEQMDDGDQTVDFDASTLSSGVYYYRLTLNGGEFTSVKKMMLLK